MKVLGKYKTVYECDSAGKRRDGEGTSYPVKGGAGKRVKLFEKGYCTREKEQSMNGVLTGETEWYGPQVLDIVYSHGKFAGYVYEDTEAPQEPFPTPDDPALPSEDQNISGGRKENPPAVPLGALKVLYTIGAGILLAFLTWFFFFDLYIRLVEEVGGQSLADYCYTFNFSGVTGMVGGIAAMILAIRILRQGSDNTYFAALPISYLIGMAAAFLLVTFLIILLQLLYRIILAVLPTVAVIIGLLALIRSFFRKK